MGDSDEEFDRRRRDKFRNERRDYRDERGGGGGGGRGGGGGGGQWEDRCVVTGRGSVVGDECLREKKMKRYKTRRLVRAQCYVAFTPHFS